MSSDNPVIPCHKNDDFNRLKEDFIRALEEQGHTLGEHGLSEQEFKQSGILRAAVETMRGRYSASTNDPLKYPFVYSILNYLKDRNRINDWASTGGHNRHDVQVFLRSGKISVLELKGCLDGNNTNIFSRPDNANEFVIWSLCSNPGADPAHNAWSGLHTRLSAEIIHRRQLVDGVIAWDGRCGTPARPCPKVEPSDHGNPEERLTDLAGFRLPPPCIYLFPETIPSTRTNPSPAPHDLEGVEFLKILQEEFFGREEELNYVWIEAQNNGAATARRTTVKRGKEVQVQSRWQNIERD